MHGAVQREGRTERIRGRKRQVWGPQRSPGGFLSQKKLSLQGLIGRPERNQFPVHLRCGYLHLREGGTGAAHLDFPRVAFATSPEGQFAVHGVPGHGFELDPGEEPGTEPFVLPVLQFDQHLNLRGR